MKYKANMSIKDLHRYCLNEHKMIKVKRGFIVGVFEDYFV